MRLIAKRRFTTPLALAVVLVGGSAKATENWPQFRGERMDGKVASDHPIRWSESNNISWSIDVPGEGWSSPVIWEDRVFVTAAVPVGAEGAGKAGPAEYSGGGGWRRDDLQNVPFRWQIICLDRQTGSELWRQTVRQSKPSIPRHSSNTYATETPIVDGDRVYAYFGMTGLYCLDLSGNLLWEKDYGSYEMRAGWGTSSSPALHDGKLFLQIDNEEQSFLVAVDAASGEEVWRVNRDEKSQYSSPFLWQNSLRDELIVGGMFYRSYDPATGKLLWQLDMEKGRSSATPVAQGDRLFVGTEFRNRGGADDGGGFLFCIKPGGQGDISPPPGQDQSEWVLWKADRSGIQMASPVVCQGNLYLLERRSGIVHCLRAANGESIYRKRISGARAFWASPWTNGEQIFCVDSGGTTFVLAAGDELEVVASNEIDEQTWSTPAVTDEAVFFRTASKLYCIRER